MYCLYFLILIKTLLYVNIVAIGGNIATIFLITSSVSILFLYLVSLINFKQNKFLLLFVYIFISCVMFGDVIYYLYFNELPSIALLGAASQLGSVKDIIIDLIDWESIVLIIDIPFLIIFRGKIKHKTRSKVLIVVSLLLVLNVFNLGFKGQLGVLERQELYTFHITDIIKRINISEIALAEFQKPEEINKEIEKFDEFEEYKERARLKDGNLTGIGKGKNLIVIQVESLQDFVIGLEYNGQEITPNLNRLIQDKSTIYYDNYYQLIGRGNTSDAEFTTHNSLYPSMDKPTYEQFVDNNYYGLPWLLRDNGYTAWAFHGYKREFWNRDAMYKSQGFQKYIAQDNYNITESIGFGLNDIDFFEQSMDYLKELDNVDNNPFYAFMITLTNHNPYKLPDNYKTLEIEDKYKNLIIANYLETVRYIDNALGVFIENLKSEGLYDETIIVLYGDHFGISSSHENNSKFMSDFLGYTYDFDEMLNVPLIIHIPNEEVGQTVSQVGSQLDFYPTIQNIMGYDNQKGLVFGRDLNNYGGENFVGVQTYMVKGSRIDNNYMIEMSRDGLFENSRVIDLETREVKETKDFIDEYEEVLKEIDNSNNVLINNKIVR